MRRPGAALAVVLAFCAVAAMLLASGAALFQWAQASSMAARWRSKDRGELTSLVEMGRRWLLSELAAGRLPRSGDLPVPESFADVRIFRADGDAGAWAGVWDLGYAPARIPPSAWERERGSDRASPPKPGAFLVRASRPLGEGPAMSLEAVLIVREVELPDGSRAFVLDPVPWIWRETWY